MVIAPFTRILGLSAKEAETVCQDAIRDIGNRNCRAYCN